MKLKSLLFVAIAALLAVASPRSAQARAEISFDFFHDALSSQGEWLEVGDYGMCWRPSGVDEDWSPYSDGYWTYTDAGWTWVSYEDYGGIVYHYGRWVSVEDEGWCWVPGYEWGPAWVSWRNNDDYTGWAPLPPEARFRRDRGISVWVDTTYDIGPSHYNFCQTQDFGAPFLRPVIINRSRNVTIIQNTVNITNITYNTGSAVVFNGGPNYANINRRAQRQIPTLKLVQNNNITINNITQVNNFKAVQQGNQLTVVAPTVLEPTAPIARAKPAKVIAAAKVNRGWGKMRDPQEREQIRAKMQNETKGLTPETAPAKAVQAADLKVLPEKADPTAPSPIKNAKDRPLPPGKRGQPEVPVADADKTPADAVVPGKMDPKAAKEKGRANEDKPAVIGNEAVPVKPGETPRLGKDRKLTPATPAPGVRPMPVEEKPVVEQSPDAPAQPPRIINDRKLKRATPEPVVRPMPAEDKPVVETPIVEKPVIEEPARVKPVKPQPFKAQPDNAAAEKARAAAEDRQRAISERQQMLLEQKQKKVAPPQAIREEAQPDKNAARARMQQQEQAAEMRRQQAEGAQRQQALREQQTAKQQQLDAVRQNQVNQNAKKQQMDAVQDQQAAKAARQQQMDGARQQQAERANAAAQQRQMMLQQQQQQRQVPAQRPMPPQKEKGKRALTPEEAAALKQTQ